MYRNVTYDYRNSEIVEWTWNKSGERVEYREPFSPYLYVETQDPKYDAISIFNTKLKKIEFDNPKARKSFTERTNKRLFYDLEIKQQYLLEKYQHHSMQEMMKHDIKTFYLDIEVYVHDTFPEAEKADYPINVITLFNSSDSKFYTWGLKEDYYPKQSSLDEIGLTEEDIVYVQCSSEKDLLECFINYWKKDYPDLITGWNSSTFDIPYLINRITKVLSTNWASKLSPIGKLYSRIRQNIFGRYYDHWVIGGVSDIDYLELYEKSEMNQHESYKLDYIASIEGLAGKVAYESANLAELADSDWDEFVTYNVQDVNIMVNLEKKKNYLKVARGKAYRGFCGLEKALDSVPIVTGMIAKAALDDNQVIVTYKPKEVSSDFEGGYVFKPSGKIHSGIVSFDVNSLYPNTMITLNTSPETKVGKVLKNGEKYIVNLVNGKSAELAPDKLEEFITKNNLIRTKANILFSQKKRGICAKFLDDMYNERKAIKAKMATEQDDYKRSQMDIEQYLLKILLNSVYGVFGNKYFGLYDIDIATSVTLTGQAMIKESTEIVQTYAKERANVDTSENIVVYGDTDSNFFDFGKILKNLDVDFFNKKDDSITVTEDAYEVIQEFEDVLNDRINSWAIDQLNTNDPRYHFSREKICFTGMFITKKNYILRVLDNEGDICDKMVEKGVELVKSSHSDQVKGIIRDVVNCIFYELGQSEASKIYKEGLEKFKQFPPAAIAVRKQAREHNKWADAAKGMEVIKGTPIHHKGAIYYNYLIDEMGLGGKYPKITTGQKIKYLYLEDNPYGMKVISFVDELPEEFGLSPDYEFQYKKMVTPLVQRCFTGNDWNLPNIDLDIETDLFDFFGI